MIAARGIVPLLVAVGCSSGATVHEVAVREFRFAPDTIQVASGDTVRWLNQDFVTHTATSTGRFDSGSIAANASWQTGFDSTGVFNYDCALHPNMRGVVIVK